MGSIGYTIGVEVSDEGTCAMNNPIVGSIEELRPQYMDLMRKYRHEKLILFQYIDGIGTGQDIRFSEIEKLCKLINSSSLLT